ncbi:hypothetical protein VTJ83DRAFT_1166 [Remersonia thermophila]|uniref:Uncharacterized protein n=1 Tax=Remersonia thermophila TaxID=72144 RepID=A0ABR4DNC5_9PEZI
MAGLAFLIMTSVVMAVASFLAGVLPLSLSLSPSQLRLITSLGAGLLVGSCLIVILPEGIEALAASTQHAHAQESRGLAGRADDHQTVPPTPELPAFNIGFALVIGFALMFLIDRLPRHAAENFQTAPTSRHVSLDNLAGPGAPGEDEDGEGDGFLGSLTPSPKQTRSLATTTGLVIHAAADGIAMGASATGASLNVGLIIFFAILVHKAPAAFGLTSVLLKQGLSKRAIRVHLMVFSLAAPAGALATFFLVSMIGGGGMEGESAQWWTGMLLLFSAGTFLYVAMHAMQEENHSADHLSHHMGGNGYSEAGSSSRRHGKLQMRDTITTLVGFLLPLLTRFGHHHH